jgi:segregation and condensation protein B
VPRKLSRAALEVLSVIAYHQPVTRSEIEEVRGVSLSKGTLELLLEIGWIRLRGRRRTPGRPVTFGTTTAFLDHFGLETLGDLPDVDELKAAGLLDQRVPPGFDLPGLAEDKAEDPIEEGAIWQDEPLGEAGEAQADESQTEPEGGGIDGGLP